MGENIVKACIKEYYIFMQCRQKSSEKFSALTIFTEQSLWLMVQDQIFCSVDLQLVEGQRSYQVGQHGAYRRHKNNRTANNKFEQDNTKMFSQYCLNFILLERKEH